MDLLRGDVDRRPVVDPYLSGGLRAWLEDGVSACCSRISPDAPLIASARSITSALATDPPGGGDSGSEDGSLLTIPMARGALVDAVFRQLVTAGPAIEPVRDALDALSIDRRHDRILQFIGALSPEDRAELLAEVADHATRLRAGWSRLPAGWLPRTNDRIRIPLAGGRLVLAASVDLSIGAPCAIQASVCLVDLVAGQPRAQHREELLFAALLETIRSGAAPCRIVAYYATTGEVRVETLTEAMLASAVQRTIDGVTMLTATGEAACPR
jgi:hypothetical protein